MKEIFNILNELDALDVDWILTEGEERQVGSNTVLIEEGTRPDSIYIVLQGLLGVRHSAVGKEKLALLGAGEVFGEVSFLDKRTASATVLALERSLLLILPHEALRRRLEKETDFAARFYRALALGNAARLRHTMRKLGTELHLVEEAMGAASVGWETLEPIFQSFKEELQEAEEAAKKNEELMPEPVKEKIGKSFQYLVAQLGQQAGENSPLPEQIKDDIGRKAKMELFPYLYLTKLGERIYNRPRGFVEDFRTIQLINANEPGGVGRLGPLLDACLLEQPAMQAIRHRSTFLQEQLLQTVEAAQGNQVEITSLACGPATEVFRTLEQLQDVHLLKAHLVDIDPQAIAYVQDFSQEKELEEQVEGINGNLVYLALGRQELDLPPQDLVYSPGLINYFNDRFVVQFINYVFQLLKPGGAILLGSFLPQNPDKTLLERVLDWETQHRSKSELTRLFQESKFGKKPKFLADGKVQTFVRCQK